MGRAGQVVARQLVERAVQTAPRDHRRSLLLERSGRGVARIGEKRFLTCFFFPVQFFETTQGIRISPLISNDLG